MSFIFAAGWKICKDLPSRRTRPLAALLADSILYRIVPRLKLFHVEQLCWGIHVLRGLAENNAACDCCMWGCPLFQGLTGDRSELLRDLFLRVKRGAENCIVSEALRG